jgi:hypothetical protein
MLILVCLRVTEQEVMHNSMLYAAQMVTKHFVTVFYVLICVTVADFLVQEACV